MVTGGEIVVEVLAGLVLMLFVTFFLLKDGARIWAWLIRVFGRDGADRADRAGRPAWLAVVYYMRGTVLVAATHALVIAAATGAAERTAATPGAEPGAPAAGHSGPVTGPPR
ncbi:MAG TPA: hypothetical protein VG268_16135 [Streptosporangiaceae bacterium]|nr:hypothetical protein [Streptosporangiaceae bacterium]